MASCDLLPGGQLKLRCTAPTHPTPPRPTSAVQDPGTEKEGAWVRVSRHAGQHGQPSVDVLESRPVEGGRRTGGVSDRDEKEGAWEGTPKHFERYQHLAFTLNTQNRNKEAISLIETCFQLRKQILGGHHPDIESSLEALTQWQMENIEIVN